MSFEKLTDGLGVEDSGAEEVQTKRIEIGAPSTPRRTIDAGWSKKKKTTVGVAAGALTLVAIAGGSWFALTSMPPGLPTDAGTAISVVSSTKFDRLDEQRQRQYLAQAARLVRDLPEEERRVMFDNEDNRDAMRRIGRAQMQEMAREMARTDSMPEMPWMRGGGRPGGRPGGGEGGRPNRENMTDEQRSAMREQMRQRIAESVNRQINAGNARDFGLAGEFWGRGGGGRRGGGNR